MHGSARQTRIFVDFATLFIVFCNPQRPAGTLSSCAATFRFFALGTTIVSSTHKCHEKHVDSAMCLQHELKKWADCQSCKDDMAPSSFTTGTRVRKRDNASVAIRVRQKNIEIYGNHPSYPPKAMLPPPQRQCCQRQCVLSCFASLLTFLLNTSQHQLVQHCPGGEGRGTCTLEYASVLSSHNIARY